MTEAQYGKLRAIIASILGNYGLRQVTEDDVSAVVEMLIREQGLGKIRRIFARQIISRRCRTYIKGRRINRVVLWDDFREPKPQAKADGAGGDEYTECGLAWARLRDGDRALLEMRYSGLSHREIGEKLGISGNAAEHRYRRAKRSLTDGGN